MDPDKFTSQAYGTVTKQPGDKWAFWYYKPKPIPRDLSLEPSTVLALSAADSAVGRLSGVGRLLTEPRMLIQPYLTREALASTRIEGTVASLSDVLQAEANEEPTDDEDVKEVLNYQQALRAGISQLDKLPLGIRLTRELHKVLLTNVRGMEKMPGMLRTSPVWIGSATDSPDTAAFVPPLPEDVPDILADWEGFLNDQPTLPLLVRCALMHYQFETIHPFLDGNGRLGRLLIILMLLSNNALSEPLLYVSPYMEVRRREYYERLQAVRERGEIQQWLQFFLTAVEHQATDAEQRALKLVDLRERYRQELKGVKSRAIDVAELLFTNPFLTVRRVERTLGLTNQGARNLIESIETRGWVSREPRPGRSGRIYWIGNEVLRIIELWPSLTSSWNHKHENLLNLRISNSSLQCRGEWPLTQHTCPQRWNCKPRLQPTLDPRTVHPTHMPAALELQAAAPTHVRVPKRGTPAPE
jgi:Fic family protein